MATSQSVFIVIEEDDDDAFYYSEIIGTYACLVKARNELFEPRRHASYNRRYILETDIDEPIDWNNRIIYALCENKLIRYIAKTEQSHPYYQGTLDDFYKNKTTMCPDRWGPDYLLYSHDHEFRDTFPTK
jgi:hypothetical protein